MQMVGAVNAEVPDVSTQSGSDCFLSSDSSDVCLLLFYRRSALSRVPFSRITSREMMRTKRQRSLRSLRKAQWSGTTASSAKPAPSSRLTTACRQWSANISKRLEKLSRFMQTCMLRRAKQIVIRYVVFARANECLRFFEGSFRRACGMKCEMTLTYATLFRLSFLHV